MVHKENQEQITGLVMALYAEFTEKMAPALPQDQNYSAAMMKRGLEILAAYIRSEDNSDELSFSQQGVYSPARLAEALRNRDASVTASDELHKLLADDVHCRRRQANPGAPSVTARSS